MPNALVSVAGTPLPTPSTYFGNTADLVDSARNVQGTMIGAVIREDVAKVELTWRYLTVAQWAGICKLFKVSEGGSFINNVTFFDQTTGLWSTRQMYPSDRSTSGAFTLDPNTGAVAGWKDCGLNLIEV